MTLLVLILVDIVLPFGGAFRFNLDKDIGDEIKNNAHAPVVLCIIVPQVIELPAPTWHRAPFLARVRHRPVARSYVVSSPASSEDPA